MPAALDVDREAVRTLAVAVGVREAARQMGLDQNTVMQWSARGKWFAPVTLPVTMRKQAVSNVSKPADALANVLLERSGRTKLGLSKATLKAAEHLGEQPAPVIVKQAQALRHLTAASAQIHGWDADNQGAPAVLVNIGLISS